MMIPTKVVTSIETLDLTPYREKLRQLRQFATIAKIDIGENRMPSKAKTQRKHANRRFMERLGVRLTDQTHHTLVRRIQSNTRISKIERQSNRVSVYDVFVDDMIEFQDSDLQKIRVVYDHNTKNIVTTLFEEGPIV